MDLLFQKSHVMILVYETTTTTTFRRITVYEKSFSFISVTAATLFTFSGVQHADAKEAASTSQNRSFHKCN